MSRKLFPKDSFVEATPVKCFGDGNCLFRAVSQILQGDENSHLELRIRVVIEMAMNIDLYCSNEHIIAMNTNVQIADPVDILWHSCIDEKHMKGTVRESLKSQLMEWVKNGCFSSLWQIYAIANVLLKPVATLYPHVFSVGLPRYLYHAILKPWLLHEEVPPLLIMWTHTQNTSIWHWQPNHFVPCLQPATFPETKPAEKVHGQMQDDDCKGSSEGVAESCADHGKITESNSIKRKWVEIFNVSKVEKKR